jgi:hydrogenase maturation protein HypF
MVRGLVQGTGYRAFAARAAAERGLAAAVRPAPGGLDVDAEGPEEALASLAEVLRADGPALASVDSVEEGPADPGAGPLPPPGPAAPGEPTPDVPPDAAACEACLAEMRDPSGRRSGHPFVSCAACGPRFTIAESAPFGRGRTTMKDFVPCRTCRGEEEEPGSRRHGAAATGCLRCGPRAWLEAPGAGPFEGGEGVREAARRLAAGEVLAWKVPGGFRLAASATDAAAAGRMREKRGRGREPFSVLAPDAAAIAAFASPSPFESRLLASPARPVVPVPVLEGGPLAPAVAPGLRTVGAMLPATGLDHLLLEAFRGARGDAPGPAVLAVAPGDPGDGPLVRGNAEAKERLAGVADAFLLHDLDYASRVPASVVVQARGARLLRRGRGFVPLPIALPVSGPPVLAAGGDLQACVCMTRGDEAFPGPPGGTMAGLLAGGTFVESVERLAALLGVRPALVVHDLHEDYQSAAIARQLADGPFRGARVLAVQHHHAHVLSCLAENGETGPAIGVVLDGTGFGPEGESWGGEVLAVDGLRWERLAHLAPLRVPGGGESVRETWRLAVAALCDLGAGAAAAGLARRWPHAAPGTLQEVLRRCRTDTTMERSSSLGRLLDAAAAIAGVADESSWEGEAALALEDASGPLPPPGEAYPVSLGTREGRLFMETVPLLGGALEDVLRGVPTPVVAARIHLSVVALLVAAVEEISRRTGIRTVALAGACLRNRVLLRGFQDRLWEGGYRVLAHAAVPPDDAGLSLGQACAGLLSLA